MVRRPPPSGRSQGRREDQRGEPDPRDDHAAELLPHVREALRHDRYGADGSGKSFAGTYNLQVVPIPTNKTMVRMDQQDLIYKSEDAKFESVVDDLVERWESGQPVLVGTVSVEKSEKLSRLLHKRGISHEVLEREAAHA